MKPNHDITSQDENVVREIVKSKRMNIPKEADEEARIARFYSLLSDRNLKDTISKHSEYVDDEGNQSSSTKGYMMKINKTIKKLFGRSVKEIADKRQIEAIDHIRHGVKRVIEKQESMRETRPKIKAEVTKTIETLFDI